MRTFAKSTLLSLLFLLIPLHPYARENAQQEDEWPAFDEQSTETVNEGQLVFLTTPIEHKVLHSDNVIYISPESLESGWVTLKQCYLHLDAVPKVEIVYRYRGMRDMKIVAHTGIANAIAYGQTVKLEDVKPNASICIQAQIQNFYRNSSQSWSLDNGPYMRKFLDGYYPFHVILKVHYPEELIRVALLEPEPQQGFEVTQEPGEISFNAWFEGKLNTKIGFTAVTATR